MLRFNGFGLKTAAAAFAGAVMFMTPASASEPTSGGQPIRGVFFSGVDVVEGAGYFYDGVIVALNRDLTRDGWLLRAYGSRVDYDARSRRWSRLAGRHHARLQIHPRPDLGKHFRRRRLSGLRLTPIGSTSEVHGTEWGFKVAGDLSTAYGSPIYANLSGSYSTAFDTYWVRLRAGVHRDKLTCGPEAIMMGNDSFEAQRFGGFITLHDLNPFRMRPFDLTLSGGYQFNGDDNGTGSADRAAAKAPTAPSPSASCSESPRPSDRDTPDLLKAPASPARWCLSCM